MSRMNEGVLDEIQLDTRRNEMALRTVAAAISEALPAQRAVMASNLTASSVEGGRHNPTTGEWTNYLRCGHPLNSGGCAP